MKCHGDWSALVKVKSPPSRGAWIEIIIFDGATLHVQSPPSRGAWIEIVPPAARKTMPSRRPPRGGRGLKCCAHASFSTGQQRRPPRGGRGLKFRTFCKRCGVIRSPPSRGAWIEMVYGDSYWKMLMASPPSRGAWIEIIVFDEFIPERHRVAPLAGGVD